MDTLKQQLQYPYKSCLISFQYIVWPPAVAITALYFPWYNVSV